LERGCTQEGQVAGGEEAGREQAVEVEVVQRAGAPWVLHSTRKMES